MHQAPRPPPEGWPLVDVAHGNGSIQHLGCQRVALHSTAAGMQPTIKAGSTHRLTTGLARTSRGLDCTHLVHTRHQGSALVLAASPPTAAARRAGHRPPAAARWPGQRQGVCCRPAAPPRSLACWSGRPPSCRQTRHCCGAAPMQCIAQSGAVLGLGLKVLASR